nr:hypothetical protein CPGR_00238 [Mycolicibacter nonchromogenicus]
MNRSAWPRRLSFVCWVVSISIEGPEAKRTTTARWYVRSPNAFVEQ